MEITILKCHGSGNDFILVDETTQPGIPEHRRSDLARELCDRNHGIGADGVLFYLASTKADCEMRIFNQDGSEAKMCGNGLRCVGRYGARQLNKGIITVATPQAVLTVSQGIPIFDKVITFEAEIGPVSFAPASLPMESADDPFIDQPLPELSDQLKFTALSAPNPHIVAFVDAIDEDVVAHCGLLANDMSRFPQGANVSFVRALGDNQLFVITYERGVGVTNACGTAMSASAYVAAYQKQVDRTMPVRVFNKGGMAVCDVSETTTVILKGNATFVFTATATLHEDQRIILDKWQITKEYTDDVAMYAKLQAHARLLLQDHNVN